MELKDKICVAIITALMFALVYEGMNLKRDRPIDLSIQQAPPLKQLNR